MYKCPECREQAELLRQVVDRDDLVTCVCGGVMKRQVTRFTAKVWKPLTLEHANIEGEGPITFYSEAELRQHCKKHKIASGALL